MHLKKRRPIISEEEVSAIFDDARVVKLASIGRLPANANKAVFSAGIREAARIFARDARIPTGNDLHAEIRELHRAADRQRYDEVFGLLESLSPAARALLQDRAARIGIELPPSDGLHDPERRRRLARRLAEQSRGSASSAVDGPKDAGGHPASNHVPFGGLCSGHQNRDGISGSGMRSGIL